MGGSCSPEKLKRREVGQKIWVGQINLKSNSQSKICVFCIVDCHYIDDTL